VEVERLKKVFLSLFVLAFMFTFNVTALADEGHSHDSNIKEVTEKFKKKTSTNHQEEMDAHSDSHQEGENHVEESTSISGHTETEGHDDGGSHGTHSNTEDQTTNQSEAGHESEGHHGPVVETPPNYKVLGTYGAINLSFIMIGVWNKWFRRKEKK
jgi:hypothetical protein